MLQLAYLQPAQGEQDLTYTVNEPDSEFLNQAIPYLHYSVIYDKVCLCFQNAN